MTVCLCTVTARIDMYSVKCESVVSKVYILCLIANVHRGPKKQDTKLLSVISPNIEQFLPRDARSASAVLLS